MQTKQLDFPMLVFVGHVPVAHSNLLNMRGARFIQGTNHLIVVVHDITILWGVTILQGLSLYTALS
jgi:hypothetical protein